MIANNIPIIIIFLFLLLVALAGFLSKKFEAAKADSLIEWSLAGKRFGAFIVWFLLGGDIYTAYTLLAVPGLAYNSGAFAFFAVSYVIMEYPILFLTIPRLWNVSKKYNFITAGDYVEKVFDSKLLGATVAIVGIFAELPYIGLQIFGMRYMLSIFGLKPDIAIAVSLFIVIVFTIFSGIRAAAVTSFIKDFFIWGMVLFLIIFIPIHYFGGFTEMFEWINRAQPSKSLIAPGSMITFGTLAFGSAGALFLYPHSINGAYTSRSADAIRKNAVFMPLYNIMLIFITILGFAALYIVPGIKNPNMAIPMMLYKTFGPYLTAFFGGIIILASMVPASIMALSSANLFTKNIYKNLINDDISDHSQEIMSKVAVGFIIVLALCLSIIINPMLIIKLQLIGGMIILQLFPLIFLPLFTNRVSKMPAIISVGSGLFTVLYLMRIVDWNIIYDKIYIGLWGVLAEIVSLFIFTFFFSPLTNISLDDYLDV
ncbi:MAG: sodium:solute symporter family protein [bacterium]